MTATSSFEPVRRESTAAVIARQLRTAIMKRALRPGEQLSEAALSGQFGVSRGPLREAMQRLVQEGLLRSEPHRGLFVMELDEAEINDIYVARAAVESAAAAAVARAQVPAALRDLRAAYDAMTRALTLDDPAALSDADFGFHDTLVRCSASRRLTRMHQTLVAETRMCLPALESTYRQPSELAKEHVQILEAIEAGDVTASIASVEQHMDAACRRLIDARLPRAEPDSPSTQPAASVTSVTPVTPVVD